MAGRRRGVDLGWLGGGFDNFSEPHRAAPEADQELTSTVVAAYGQL